MNDPQKDSTGNPNIDRLRDAGMIVGERDPNQNRAFKGRYMVAEPRQPDDPYPTDDAQDGRFCLVGDNLDALAAEAIWALDLD